MRPQTFAALLLALLGTTPLIAGPFVADPELARRLERLEAETQSLRAELQSIKHRPIRSPQVTAAPAGLTGAAMRSGPANNEADLPTLEEFRKEMKSLAWTKGDFRIVPYGILWTNMAYSTERTAPGPYTVYVHSADDQGEDEFIVDARSTRLGFDVSGPRIPWFHWAESGGKVEVDFWDDGLTTENRVGVMLRHGYWEVKDEYFRFLAGQTWDIISPLYPNTLMYSIGWCGGNIGYRRAQIRGERYLPYSDTLLLTLQGSLNQDIFSDRISNVTGRPSDWPVLEGRAAATLGPRGRFCRPITFGVSGHIGEQEYDVAGGLQDQRRRTWSFNIDVLVPVTDRLSFKGELFTGENLGAFLGGANQGIDPVTGNGIRSTGGWFDVGYDWTPCLHSHAGFGIDNPVNRDVTLGRIDNRFYFVNITYDVTEKLLLGFEVSSWKTLWTADVLGSSRRPGDAACFEFAAKYAF